MSLPAEQEIPDPDSNIPSSCCAPSRVHQDLAPQPPKMAPKSQTERHGIPQAYIPGGTFLMGDAQGDGKIPDGETPVHSVELTGFSMDIHSVTNADFDRFVEDTGYVTEAELFSSSAVFHSTLEAPPEDVLGRPPQAPWWLGVAGADWRHPRGRNSTIDDIQDHPVVHVSWNDAQAYCHWSERRLPTEAEWEFASRGGLSAARFPWGDELGVSGNTGDAWPLNIWQGEFPHHNTAEDGWLTTSPAMSFSPNALGVWQTVGNVWEWCQDWFDPRYYSRSPRANPEGPDRGAARVLRGGSFLCHDSYCKRYRNAARSSNEPSSSTANAGFRTVANTAL